MKVISQAIPRARIPFDFLHIHHAIAKSNGFSYQGIGVASTAQQAFLLAKYEMLERLAGSFSLANKEDLHFGNLSSLNVTVNAAFNLDQIVLFHREQNEVLPPVGQYINNHPVSWVKCTSAREKTPVYLPSSFIFFDYPTKFYFPNSAGSAIHTIPALAKRNALYELIEKATIARIWYLQKKQLPPRFSLHQLRHLLPIHYRNLGTLPHHQFSFYHHPCFDTHVILCVGKFTAENGQEKIAVGSSCNISLKKSIKKALKECMKNIVMVNNYLLLDKLKHFSNVEKATSFLGHFLYFNSIYDNVSLPLLSAPQQPVQNIHWNKVEEKEAVFFDEFIEKYQLLFYENTLRHENDTYYFTKFFSPDFLPFSSHYKYPYLGNLNHYSLNELFLTTPHLFP